MSVAAEPLVAVAQAGLAAAASAGAHQAEACVVSSTSVDARAEQNDLGAAEAATYVALGLRVVCDGAVGFAAVNRLEPEAVADAARRAVVLARSGAPEPGFTLPPPAAYATVDGLHDPATANATVTQAVEACHAVLTATRAVDARISVDAAGASFHQTTRVLANSHGVTAQQRTTGGSLYVVGLAADGQDVTGMDHEEDAQVVASRLQPELMGRTLGQRLLRQLDPRAYDGPSQPLLVLSPDVLEELLLDPLLASMEGEAVRLGTSRLASQQGQPVAAGLLSLSDDPLAPGEPGSTPFDREGVPRRPTALVAQGVLQGWLHHAQSAFRMGQPPTGHAVGGATGLPGVGLARLVVAPGTASLADLVAEAKDGVLVGRFSGTVDEVSGDFSGVAKCSWRIRNGVLAEPLRETTVAGNAWKALMAVQALTAQRQRRPQSLLPHALVAGLSVSGG